MADLFLLSQGKPLGYGYFTGSMDDPDRSPKMYKEVKVTVSFECEKCNATVTQPYHKVVTNEPVTGMWGHSDGTTSNDVTCPKCYTSYGIEVE